MLFARFTEQLADVMDAIPTFVAATGAKTLDRVENRFRLVAGKIVIDIDDQNRRPLAEAGSLAKTGKRKNFFVARRSEYRPKSP